MASWGVRRLQVLVQELSHAPTVVGESWLQICRGIQRVEMTDELLACKQ